jgi:hypothetical protein
MVPLLFEVKNITGILEKRYLNSRLYCDNALTLITPILAALLIFGNLNFIIEDKKCEYYWSINSGM